MRYTASLGWAPSLMAAALATLVVGFPLDLPVARATGQGYRADTLPVDKIRRGMTGYGLTVFEGTRPERFGVEVIDVVKNYQPAQDIILIRTRHPRLEVTNSVAGMSGSPIFIDGKMVGAYALGWSFGKEPVAGVTPIQNMIDDIERPLPKQIFGWPLSLLPPSRTRPLPAPAAARPPHSAHRYVGTPGDYQLARHAEQLAVRDEGLGLPQGMPRRLATPVLMGGMGSVAMRMARQLFEPLGLEPLQAGGGGGGIDPDAPEHYEEGGAICVQLIRGDINATPLGTVTRVEGDRLVAFGHPMMGAGVTALPTAIGRVSWILASEDLSSKFGVAARPLGALINDRQASIVVSESAKAPVIPVILHVAGVPGAPKHDWSFEIAHEPFSSPAFLSMALGNALQATGAERQDVTWRAKSQVAISGYGEIAVEDFGVAVGGMPDPQDFMRSQVVSAVGEVLNNPWREAVVQSVTTKIELTYAREVVRLRGARSVEPELDAGQPAHLSLTFIPFAGPPFTRTLSVPLPRHLAGSTVKLTIRPGHAVQRERAEPESFDDFIANLESPIYPPKSIVVSYASGGGVAFKGQVAKDLPPGALDSIQQQSASYSPEAFRSEQRQVIEQPFYVVGEDTVTIKVRPQLR
jgi:hypothetical protein